jgi:hypothetical protein
VFAVFEEGNVTGGCRTEGESILDDDVVIADHVASD